MLGTPPRTRPAALDRAGQPLDVEQGGVGDVVGGGVAAEGAAAQGQRRGQAVADADAALGGRAVDQDAAGRDLLGEALLQRLGAGVDHGGVTGALVGQQPLAGLQALAAVGHPEQRQQRGQLLPAQRAVDLLQGLGPVPHRGGARFPRPRGPSACSRGWGRTSPRMGRSRRTPATSAIAWALWPRASRRRCPSPGSKAWPATRAASAGEHTAAPARSSSPSRAPATPSSTTRLSSEPQMMPLSKALLWTTSAAAAAGSASAQTRAGTFPEPTPMAGVPELDGGRTIARPPGGRTQRAPRGVAQ